jgi:uncharacterized membrane protein HdeD (DUF308 family)
MTANLTGPPTAASGVGTGLRVVIGLLGLAAVAVGVVLLFDPVGAASTLAVLLGVALVVLGLLEIAYGWEGPHRVRALVLGAVLVAGGVLVAAWPDTTLKTVALLVGISLMVHGALRVAIAVAERHEIPQWGWLAAAGAVNFLFGILVIAWPEATILVLCVVLGVQVILFGVLLLLAAFLTGRGRVPAAA